jgi:hypothetical protein
MYANVAGLKLVLVIQITVKKNFYGVNVGRVASFIDVIIIAIGGLKEQKMQLGLY